MNAATLPSELSELRELVVTLKAALELTRQENSLLRQKIDALVRRVFGSSSEQLDRSQLELLLQLSASATPAEPTAVITPKNEVKVQPRKSRAPRLPDHLPVMEEVIDPEPVKTAPEQWRCIGQEVSEQLDYEPARFLRRRIIRRKYVHRTEVGSRSGDRALAGTLAGPQPAGAGIAGAHLGQQILRSSAAVSAGTDLRPTPSESICPGRRWRAGWSWPPTGSNPFTNRSAPE